MKLPPDSLISSERVLKIDRERDCERGGADGEARRGRIFERNLQPRSNEASRLAPPQDRPIYFQNTLSEKITHYLLVPLARGDKSAFLSQAGYTRENPVQLLDDLRRQILPLDAVNAGENKFGRYYESRGLLRGPNGVALNVRAIWMTEHLSGITKFVTLIPDKQKQ